MGALGQRLGQALAWTTSQAVFADLRAAVPALAEARFGAEMPTVQLRFKGSRG
jgi:hypothetical protein